MAECSIIQVLLPLLAFISSSDMGDKSVGITGMGKEYGRTEDKDMKGMKERKKEGEE
jgi:hypothetical protein